MISERCAICDCDRQGNVWPESAESLCAAHWLLGSVRSLVQAGAWSEFDMDTWGKRPNHAAMLLVRDAHEAEHRHPWRAGALSACNVKRVTWDAGTGDTNDSEADRYTLMTGLVAAWVWRHMERAMIERERRAA